MKPLDTGTPPVPCRRGCAAASPFGRERLPLPDLIRRLAAIAGLTRAKRKKAEDCARYLVNKSDYLDYPAASVALDTGQPRLSSAAVHLAQPRCQSCPAGGRGSHGSC